MKPSLPNATPDDGPAYGMHDLDRSDLHILETFRALPPSDRTAVLSRLQRLRYRAIVRGRKGIVDPPFVRREQPLFFDEVSIEEVSAVQCFRRLSIFTQLEVLAKLSALRCRQFAAERGGSAAI